MQCVSTKRKWLLAALSGAGLIGCQAVWASEPEHLTLEEIIVTDTALPVAAISEVGGKSIEKGKKLNIVDAIEDEPDITTSRRASVGDTADSVAIRGLSLNRIMLNINGRSVNGAGVVGGHYIDWGTIPLDNIEKIEIIRGGSSVEYGNNALGGVINVITKKPTDKPDVTLSANAGIGEDGYTVQNYRFTHSYKVGKLGYSLAGSFQNSDEFLWNNDFSGKNINLSTNYDMPFDGQFSLGMQYANADRGFIRNNRRSDNPDNPGFYLPINPDFPLSFGETFSPYSGNAFIPGPGAEWDKTKYYFDFGYSQPLGDGLAELKIYKNYEDRKEKNYSLAGLVAGYGDGSLVMDRDVESDRSYGGTLKVTKPLGDHEILAGIDHQILSYGDITLNFIDRAYNNVGWFGPPATSHSASSEGVSWGYYARDSWKITDKLLLTGGVRYDTYCNKSINDSTAPDLEDEALTPKLTVTYGVTDSDKVTVSLYQAMRTPGLPETYWWSAGMTGGDPVLKPEKNNAGELVYQHDLQQTGFLRFSAYYYDIADYIMFRLDPNWRGVYNIDKAILHGASLDGRVALTDWLAARASLAYQKSKKEGDLFDTAHLTDEIDYLPEWKGNLGAEVKLPYQMVLTADLRYVGERQALYAYSTGWPAQSRFRLETLDAYTTADLDLKIPVMKNGEVSLYVENLFDKGYEERFGYSLPGRIIGAALKITF